MPLDLRYELSMSKLTPRQERFVAEYLVDPDRFWSNIDTSAGEHGCWPWTGCRDTRGYGRFHVGVTRNSSMLAHRIAYGITHGTLPEAVCHKCDNPSCCNPTHLFGGTRAMNNHDMCDKRRHWAHVDPSRAVKGEDHGQAKLDTKEVLNIRLRYKTGLYTQRELATEFGVCQRTINKIVRNLGWSHV